MNFRLFNYRANEEIQEIFLGNGSYSLKISKEYLNERDENEGTVLIYPKGSECIILRFDILSFSSNGESVESTTGYDYILGKVEEKSKKLYTENDKAISYSESTSNENGAELIMKFWEIGPKDNRIIIMSATILKSMQNDKRVRKLLELIPGLIKSIESTEIHDSIITSTGSVEYTTKRQEPVDQAISELEDSDKDFINNWIVNGENIIRYYIPDFKLNNLSFEILDFVFSKWLNDKSEEKFNSDSLANGLGVLFGELLSGKLKMHWVKVNDKQGVELGVRTSSNYIAFPISSVFKRIETKEMGFFANIFEMLKYMTNKNIV